MLNKMNKQKHQLNFKTNEKNKQKNQFLGQNDNIIGVQHSINLLFISNKLQLNKTVQVMLY